MPRQLPTTVTGFVGRSAELAMLTKVLEESAGQTMTTFVISGMGGIGKTCLALHWAREHLASFPDGQLYVDLRGFSPSGSPMSTGAALRVLLEALRVRPAEIPVDIDSQSALYRTLMADRRMLVVLDNARDVSQVGPLFPGSPACTVLITSRLRLTSLAVTHGAQLFDLDMLAGSEAHDLLSGHIGSIRSALEPHVVADFIAYCGGLPLALGIVGARAAARPDFPLAVLAAELHDAADRIDVMTTDELTGNVRSVLSWSADALRAEEDEVFRLLALAPGPDISVEAAASLVASSVSRVRVLLRRLESAHLIQQYVPGRYRMHDLVRLYAIEQAEARCSGETVEEAMRRVADFYVHTSHSAARMLDSHPPSVQPRPSVPGCSPQRLNDGDAAMVWFRCDYPHLLAVQRLAVERGLHAVVWHLASALTTFQRRQGHLHDHLASWRAGLDAAEHLGLREKAEAHLFLGVAYARVGQHIEAFDHLGQAIDYAGQAADKFLQARAQQALGYAWELRGDYQQALVHATDALRRFETLDRPVLEANALNGVGWYNALLGNHGQAWKYCEAALVVCSYHNDKDVRAATLDTLGYIAHHAGQPGLAVSLYGGSLALTREIGDAFEEAEILNRLGEAHAVLGNHEAARQAWSRAMSLYRAQQQVVQVKRLQLKLSLLGSWSTTPPASVE